MDDATQANVRAESVPPNIVCTNTSAFLPRAQSERPFSPATYRPYATPIVNGQPYLQNQHPRMSHIARRGVEVKGMESPTLYEANHPPLSRAQSERPFSPSSYGPFAGSIVNGQPYAQNQLPRVPRIPRRSEAKRAESPSIYESSQPTSQYTNFMNNHNNGNASGGHLNNDLNSSQCPTTPQRFIYHNNNTAAAANNANINNQLQQQQNIASSIADVPGTSSAQRLISSGHGTNSTNTNRIYSPSLPPSQTHALNNQVAPGNRANNYWDNFKR